MTQTEALRLALEALGSNRRTHHYCEDTWYSCPKHEDGCANDSEGDECNCGADKANAGIDQAITAIKAALEAKDEPVAWQYRDANDDGTWTAWNGCDKRLTESDWRKVRPLYTTPPQRTWVGLTDEEISELIRATHNTGSFVRAIEAKLKEKNT